MLVTIYYYWNTDIYSKKGGECEITLFPRDLSASYYKNDVFIQSLEVEIPDCPAPSREKQVELLLGSLDRQEAAINAETFVKLKALSEKRQQLLCLTCEEESCQA